MGFGIEGPVAHWASHCLLPSASYFILVARSTDFGFLRLNVIRQVKSRQSIPQLDWNEELEGRRVHCEEMPVIRGKGTLPATFLARGWCWGGCGDTWTSAIFFSESKKCHCDLLDRQTASSTPPELNFHLIHTYIPVNHSLRSNWTRNSICAERDLRSQK